MIDVKIIKKNPAFKKFPLSSLSKIAKDARIFRFKRKQIIIREKAKPDYVYFILKGKVQVFKFDEVGREKTLAILSEGDVFGEMAPLSSSRRSAFIKALENVKAIGIASRNFKTLVKEDVSMANLLNEILVRRLERVDKYLEVLSYESVRKKIVGLLLLFGTIEKKKKRKVRVYLTQVELAGMINSAREVINRNLQALRRKKLVKIERKFIEVPSIRNLREYLLKLE
ncbi:MAG: Crp/Fnr family transcriptional regulator [Elusimicrobia bacterium]|nr:Crp/Fnr family transcriptional regulator [Elusimicrobiota bacterium]